MRTALLILALALCACTTEGGGGVVSTLQPADAATGLIAGGPITMRVVSTPSSNDDPLTVLTLSRADGRSMMFTEANHAPHDVMAQASGGPLAQIMGLFGDERPVLYHRRDGGSGAPFFCGAAGPVSIGVYTAADGHVTIVGMKSDIEFEEQPGAAASALPFSPDQVCARMRFTKS